MPSLLATTVFPDPAQAALTEQAAHLIEKCNCQVEMLLGRGFALNAISDLSYELQSELLVMGAALLQAGACLFHLRRSGGRASRFNRVAIPVTGWRFSGQASLSLYCYDGHQLHL